MNFLIFNHFYNKVGRFQETLALNSNNKDLLIQLTASAKIKEDRVNAVLSASNSRTSFYMDRIAKNVPASVLLSEMLFQPLDKTISFIPKITIKAN